MSMSCQFCSFLDVTVSFLDVMSPLLVVVESTATNGQEVTNVD